MYTEWLRKSLILQCPMVFYCDNEGVKDLVTNIRKRLKTETHFAYRNLQNISEKFKYSKKWISPKHVTSSSLATIWLDKVFMIDDAAQLNPFKSEWFAWCGE